MAQIRKTRQQKIKLAQRKTSSAVQNHEEKVTTLPASINIQSSKMFTEVEDTQKYVVEELRRISWITLICASILALATLLLADFSWAQDFRSWLPW